MKTLLLSAILMLVSTLSFAQQTLNDEVEADLNQIAAPVQAPVQAPAQVENTAPAVQVNVSQDTAAVTNNQANQPVITLQKQQPTLVESTPLTASRAEELRKSREELERQTEDRIVQKLETSRIEDEKRRADALLGNKLDQSAAVAAPAPAVIPATTLAPVAPAPVVEVAPAPSQADVEAMIDQKLAAKDEAKKAEKVPNKTNVGLLLGVTDYPDVKNVSPAGSIGVGIGLKYDDRMLVEGGFVYSRFDVEQRDGVYFCDYYTCETYPRITNLDQYNASLALKYQILGGTFRPVIGGIASYTYRIYEDQQFALNDNSASSQAIDAGALTGFDLELSEKFSLGFDYKYLWNIINWSRNDGYQRSMNRTVLGGDKQLEKLSYQTFSVNARFSF